MAKRSLAFAMISLFILSTASAAYCDDALEKLGRGICNSVTFPLEIVEQINRTNINDGPMAAVTLGLLKGVGMAALRAVVGVYEIATFPIPLPKHYDPILTDPEYFLENTSW
jgi:putative exosortase-associated protein (TIGR04073 family)